MTGAERFCDSCRALSFACLGIDTSSAVEHQEIVLLIACYRCPSASCCMCMWRGRYKPCNPGNGCHRHCACTRRSHYFSSIQPAHACWPGHCWERQWACGAWLALPAALLVWFWSLSPRSSWVAATAYPGRWHISQVCCMSALVRHIALQGLMLSLWWPCSACLSALSLVVSVGDRLL